jgi:hypothetical protein
VGEGFVDPIAVEGGSRRADVQRGGTRPVDERAQAEPDPLNASRKGSGKRRPSPPVWSTVTNVATATSAPIAMTQATETPPTPLRKASAGLPDSRPA